MKAKKIKSSINESIFDKKGGAIVSPYSFIGMLWRVCDAAQSDFSQLDKINHDYMLQSSIAKYFRPADFKHQNHILGNGSQNISLNAQEQTPYYINSWWNS